MHDELTRQGGRLLAISVDPVEKCRKLVESLALPFAVLSDEKRETVRAYGLVHPGGGPGGSDIAIPALLLVGEDAGIRWRHVSARAQDRMDPEAVLEFVRMSR